MVSCDLHIGHDDSIEFNIHGIPQKEMREACKKMGLKIRSGGVDHISNVLRSNFNIDRVSIHLFSDVE